MKTASPRHAPGPIRTTSIARVRRHLGLIVMVAILSFVFLGDAVADLVTLIGGRVDQETLPK